MVIVRKDGPVALVLTTYRSWSRPLSSRAAFMRWAVSMEYGPPLSNLLVVLVASEVSSSTRRILAGARWSEEDG